MFYWPFDDPQYRNPVTEEFNLGYQWALTNNSVVEVELCSRSCCTRTDGEPQPDFVSSIDYPAPGDPDPHVVVHTLGLSARRSPVHPAMRMLRPCPQATPRPGPCPVLVV